MQAASSAAPKRRLRQRARLLVQGIDAAPAAEQTETGFDAGRVAPRVQADRQSAVIVDAASPARANMQWIKSDSLRAALVRRASTSAGIRSRLLSLDDPAGLVGRVAPEQARATAASSPPPAACPPSSSARLA